jgi:hypothetical protein
MRKSLGFALIAAASGCAQQVSPPSAVVAVTASDQRATGDLVPQFTAEAAAGELHVVAMLGDRLKMDAFPGPSIQLTATEHLYAVIGTSRVPLVEELYAVPGFEGPTILWTRYVATVAVGDLQSFAIELDRADGTIVSSTVRLPARFAIASPPPSNIKTGDSVAFAISPVPGADSWGYWDAWCDATPSDLIVDGNYDDVYVSADGQGRFQLGATRSNTSKDCAAQLRIRLYALGDYSPAFGSNVGPTTVTHPTGLQDVEVGVHLWAL